MKKAENLLAIASKDHLPSTKYVNYVTYFRNYVTLCPQHKLLLLHKLQNYNFLPFGYIHSQTSNKHPIRIHRKLSLGLFI